MTEDRRYSPIFSEHLQDEFGHDSRLAGDRAGSLTEVWDPVLEAASNWFAWKMLSLDNVEKMVLVHQVLEVGGSLISQHARDSFTRYNETDYFAIHAVADDEHQRAGLSLLEHLDAPTYERLFQLQKEGWDMLNLLLARIAELTNEW